MLALKGFTSESVVHELTGQIQKQGSSGMNALV